MQQGSGDCVVNLRNPQLEFSIRFAHTIREKRERERERVSRPHALDLIPHLAMQKTFVNVFFNTFMPEWVYLHDCIAVGFE